MSPRGARDPGIRRAVAEWAEYLRELGVTGLAVRPRGSGPAPSVDGEPDRCPPGPAAAASPRRRGGEPHARELFTLCRGGAADAGDPVERLRAVREDLGDCTRCKLHAGRTHIVFGVGDPHAGLMFVGEGPGADEDAQGEPFVGRAGQLLNRMIAAVGLERSAVYIANVVKCRPPENRTPEPDEVATCAPFLFRQIEAIRPRVIVALGSPATKTLIGTRAGITQVRGTWGTFRGIPVMPTFHPAYLLRAYTEENRRLVWSDLKAARARMDTAP